MKKYILLCALLLFLPCRAWAGIRTVTVTERCVIGDNQSRQTAMKECLKVAKARAIELTGSYLESYTNVADYQLVTDRIFSFSAGIIRTRIIREETKLSGSVPIITLTVKARVDTGLLTELINKFRLADHERILFEEGYTDQSADQYGRIRTFVWGEHGERPGDRLEVTAHIPQGAREVMIWRGADHSPKWTATQDGYFKATIEHIHPGKYFGIWLEKNSGVVAQVTLIRASPPGQSARLRKN